MSLRELSVHARAHADAVWSVDWSRSELIVSGGVDETLKAWSVDADASALDGKPQFIASAATILRTSSNNEALPSSASLSLNTVATLPGSGLLASSSMDGTIRLYDTTSLEARKIEAGALESWTIAADPSGQFIATGSQKGHVNVFAVESGQLVATLQGEKAKDGSGTTAFVMSVAWSANGRFIAAGHFDGRVTLFEMNGAQQAGQPRSLQPHTKCVRALRFSPDGALLFSGSDDAHVHWYETAAGTGQMLHDLFAHQSWVTGIALPSADAAGGASSSSTSASSSTHFATVSTDKKLKLWSLASKECIATLELDSSAWSVAFDPTGEKIVVGTEAGSLVLVKASTQ